MSEDVSLPNGDYSCHPSELEVGRFFRGAEILCFKILLSLEAAAKPLLQLMIDI